MNNTMAISEDKSASNPMNLSKVSLYPAWYCPFVQRTWVALEQLEIPYEYLETDPYLKTEDWLTISRGVGQVPVVKYDHEGKNYHIPDSYRTLEFLDEAQERGLLYGNTPASRSEHRYWLDFISRKIVPYFYRVLKSSQMNEERALAETELLAGLSKFARAMDETGPFFSGFTPMVVDIAMAPFYQRIELLLTHYRGFVVPKHGSPWLRLQQWWDAVQQLPSFQASKTGDNYDERLIEFYLPYSKGGGQSDVTRTMS